MLLDEKINDLQNLTKRRITKLEIAKILGLGGAQAVLNRINRKQELKEFEIIKLDDAFENEINTNKKTFISSNIDKDVDCVDLPVRGNLSASLGYGVEIIDETQTGVYSVSKKLIRDVGANQKYTDFILCEGDSMYPTIEGGALLMVDRSKTEIFDGKIYCIRLNNNLMAKRLQFLPPNKVKVISDNKEKYDAFYIDLSQELDFDFAIVGEVKWYGTIVK